MFPRLLELACGVKPTHRQRQKIGPLARGEVLEIGNGTGLNLPFCDRSCVKSIVGVAPVLALFPLAMRRAERAGMAVGMAGLSAETLPLPGRSFDTIECTCTPCSIPHSESALAQMHRVLANGVKLPFSEHGRAPDASLRRWQRRLQPLWGPLAGGCRLDRDIPGLLRAAGS